MGRPRSKHFDLPPKVQRKGDSYYYVTLNKGCRLWIRLGTEREESFALAEQLRKGAIAGVQKGPRVNLRAEVMQRDGFRCVYCGATTGLCVDHVVPLSRGGANVRSNVVVACVTCNNKKRSKHPRYFAEQLQKVDFN